MQTAANQATAEPRYYEETTPSYRQTVSRRPVYEVEEYPSPTQMMPITKTKKPQAAFVLSKQPAHPPIDILDREGFYEIRCEMPGITRRDVQIDVFANGLMIRSQPAPIKYWNRYEPIVCTLQQQRCQDPIEEWVPLPPGCNMKRARAKLNLGILNIKVPKHVYDIERGKGFLRVQ